MKLLELIIEKKAVNTVLMAMSFHVLYWFEHEIVPQVQRIACVDGKGACCAGWFSESLFVRMRDAFLGK